MPRPLIEGLRSSQIEPTSPAEGPFAGVPVRYLSADDKDPGEWSGIAEITADGWSASFGAERSVDIVVLQGRVAVDGSTASVGHYAFVPRDHGSVVVTAEPGSAFFFGIGARGSGDGEVVVLDPETVPWTVRTRENVPHSSTGMSINIVKFVRTDPVTDDRSGFGAMFPTTGLDCAEWHEAIDEGLVLRGSSVVFGPDASLVELAAGSYYWRPANARHLPKYSFDGSLSFFRTHGTGWNSPVYFAAEPRWPALLADYVERRKRDS